MGCKQLQIQDYFHFVDNDEVNSSHAFTCPMKPWRSWENRFSVISLPKTKHLKPKTTNRTNITQSLDFTYEMDNDEVDEFKERYI